MKAFLIISLTLLTIISCQKDDTIIKIYPAKDIGVAPRGSSETTFQNSIYDFLGLVYVPMKSLSNTELSDIVSNYEKFTDFLDDNEIDVEEVETILSDMKSSYSQLSTNHSISYIKSLARAKADEFLIDIGDIPGESYILPCFNGLMAGYATAVNNFMDCLPTSVVLEGWGGVGVCMGVYATQILHAWSDFNTCMQQYH